MSMTRLNTLPVGSRFTFAPRLGVWEVVSTVGESSPSVAYRAVDDEAREVSGDKVTTALSAWKVWPLD